MVTYLATLALQADNLPILSFRSPLPLVATEFASLFPAGSIRALAAQPRRPRFRAIAHAAVHARVFEDLHELLFTMVAGSKQRIPAADGMVHRRLDRRCTAVDVDLDTLVVDEEQRVVVLIPYIAVLVGPRLPAQRLRDAQ